MVPLVMRRGIDSGSQVGVDLLAQRAWQEAESFARLNCGSGEDDPVDLLVLQGLNSLGHRQVGLSGACRADPKDHGVLVDRVDVFLLAKGLWPN